MITAVDSNIIYDVLTGEATYEPASSLALAMGSGDGGLIVCEVVLAEVAAGFPDSPALLNSLDLLEIGIEPIGREAAFAAGARWRDYRLQGGPRARILPDFLIGAHALYQADRLLTRDRGFYRAYFKDLSLLDPTA